MNESNQNNKVDGENFKVSRKDKKKLKRAEKKERRKKDGKLKKFARFTWTSFWVLSLLSLVMAAIGALGVVVIVNKELEDLPLVDAQFLETYPTSEITDKNGEVIWKPTDYRIGTMTYEEIPDMYKEFLVSVEDKEFWESKGYSPKGIFNMVVGTVRSKVDTGYKARGGSTIDQQLIKNKYFNGGEGINVVKRKVQEIFLSMQLNSNFKKEEILTFYVNDLDFAERATGVKAIMKTYFNKTPESYKERNVENIAEMAYLVGLSQAPTMYNLYENPKDGEKRKKTVLNIAFEDGLITEKEFNEAKNFDLTTNLQPRRWEDEIQYNANLKYKVYTDGVKKELKELGYDLDKVSIKVVTHLDKEIFGKIEEKVRNSKYYLDENQQIAATVIDHNGVVVGMVGSRYGGKDELNRAMQTTRSTGSSTKPMLAYAPLLQYFGDRYNTASKFNTANYRYPGTNSIMHNYGKAQYGYQTMQYSLNWSLNTPVGRIMDDILGSGRVSEFLSGLDLDNQEQYSSVDGLGIHASTLQVASAYNAFNNAGEFTKPRFIDKIVFSNKKEKVIAPRTKKAMNPSVAWVVSHMMRSVASEDGTAKEGAIKGYEGYGGKTGTVGFSSSVKAPAPYGIGGSDLWYNSFTNEGYTISVWTGYDKPNVSPQLPDTYKRYLHLSRDLHLMLNKKAPSVWKMPSGVSKISGEGKKAFYRVTDSADSYVKDLSWIELNEYKKMNLKNANGNSEVDPDWESKEESVWLEYYKQGGDESPTVIDEDLYNKMKGDE